jgi:gas vesicle protein
MSRFSKTHVAEFFIAGAAVGAAVALLYAPKTGTEMRKDIRRLSEKALDQLDELQSDIREQVTERYGQVRKMINIA